MPSVQASAGESSNGVKGFEAASLSELLGDAPSELRVLLAEHIRSRRHAVTVVEVEAEQPVAGIQRHSRQ